MSMDYQEAVALAKSGKEEGFRFLYEATYQSKLYLAVQYMKNEHEAEDVLQEAYIRAFSRLDSLQQPQAFPGWLGRIVANTAKNRWVKAKPMLFADINPKEGGEFEPAIEDETISVQPELAYMQQERNALVHELIDSLSTEQRICILMFYMEGNSIRQIAAALDCSENTVKSRLNYGRKNIKARSEQLRKKGYCLYGVAPLPLLVYLLRAQGSEMCASGAYAGPGKAIADRVFADPQIRSIIDGASGLPYAAKTGMDAAVKATVKSGFLHTAAAKTAAVILGLCVAGGAVYGAARLLPSLAGNGSETAGQEAPPATPAALATAEAETTPIATAVPEHRTLAAADYPALIAGGLTQRELEFVLAYGPEEIPEQGFSLSDYTNLLNSLCMGAESSGIIKSYGINEAWEMQYDVGDINRLFAAFTDYRFEEDAWNEGFIRVEGNILKYVPATLNYTVKVDITAAEYAENELNIEYTYHYTSYERPSYTAAKKAVLKPDEDGAYRIVRIEAAQVQPEPAEGTPSADPAFGASEADADRENQADGTTAIKKLYAAVLDNGDGELYGLCDINGDGIQELLLGTEIAEGPFIYYEFTVYSCEKQGDRYALKPISGNATAMDPRRAGDGNGLYAQQISRGTGTVEVFRMVLQEGKLITGGVERKMTLGSPECESFYAENPRVEWIDVADRSALGADE